MAENILFSCLHIHCFPGGSRFLPWAVLISFHSHLDSPPKEACSLKLTLLFSLSLHSQCLLRFIGFIIQPFKLKLPFRWCLGCTWGYVPALSQLTCSVVVRASVLDLSDSFLFLSDFPSVGSLPLLLEGTWCCYVVSQFLSREIESVAHSKFMEAEAGQAKRQ